MAPPADAHPEGPGPTAGLDLALFAALALVTLPFHPLWIDFEQARRGLGMLAAAALLVATLRNRQVCWPPGAGWFAALLAWWSAVTLTGVANNGAALERIGHGTALLGFLVFGARRRPAPALAAVAALGAVLAIHGIAQCAGLAWPADYAPGGEPVATLANRNAAGEMQAITFAAALALRPARPMAMAAGGVAALLIAVHLALLGSRGPLLAAVVAGAVAAGVRAGWRSAPWAAGARAVIVLAVAAALTLRLTAVPAPEQLPDPAGSAPVAAEVEDVRGDTVAVRLALWAGALDLLGERPIAGHGPGQFRFEYPRHRSQEEIERTTFGRRFPTVATTAHNDALDLAVDGGLVGVLLALAALVAATRGVWRSGAAGPAVAVPLALLVAGLTRAPLGNAPAAAAAFAVLGAIVGPGAGLRRAGLGPRLATAAVAAALVVGGARIVLGANAAAAGVAANLDADMLGAAVAWHPSEPRYRNLRIQAATGGVAGGALARVGPDQLGAVEAHVDALLALDPHNTNTLFLAAQLLHGGGRSQRAIGLLEHVLELDPRHPRATQLLAVIQAEAGNADAALATLLADPHPALRDRLAADLELLAAAPRVAAHPTARARLAEAAGFVATLDAILADPGGIEANARVRAFADLVGPSDDRARILLARQFQALDRAGPANALAPEALQLDPDSARLLAPVLDALAALPAWQPHVR